LTRIQNKLKQYRNNPKSVTFEELKILLLSYGFEVNNYSGGSHFSVSHSQYTVIRPMEPNTIPMKKPNVLEVYVKRAIRWIDRVVELQAEEEKDETKDKND